MYAQYILYKLIIINEVYYFARLSSKSIIFNFISS
jgi:hypothetical protein